MIAQEKEGKCVNKSSNNPEKVNAKEPEDRSVEIADLPSLMRSSGLGNINNTNILSCTKNHLPILMKNPGLGNINHGGDLAFTENHLLPRLVIEKSRVW